MTMKKLTLVIALVFTTLTYAAYAQGTETRNVSSFDQVHVSGSFEVMLAKGNTESVKIESSSLELDKIETEVEGNKLKIGLKKGTYRNTGNIKVYVTYKEIEGIHSSGSSSVTCNSDLKADNFELHTSGSGSIKIASLNTNALKIHNSGSGSVEVAGTAKKQSVNISGSSKINAFDLKSEESEVSISGSGNVNINVTQSLEARVSGSGDIRYKGNPDIRNIHVSGSGNIKKVN
jgi:hypothetical protein